MKIYSPNIINNSTLSGSLGNNSIDSRLTGSFSGSFSGDGSGLTGVGGSSPSVISTSILTSDTNNYSPTGWSSATMVKLSGDSSIRYIGGFSAETSGEEKILINTGSYPIYLAPEHASSSAANRIAYFEEVFLMPGQSCKIIYDGGASRWIPFNVPCPGYRTDRTSVYYDVPVGPVPTAASSDNELDIFGSITPSNGAPSSTSVPFAYWDMDSGATTSGGAGIFYPQVIEDMAWFGGAHMITRAFVRFPAAVGDATNNYYIFLRLGSNPSSGFFTQNSSTGIYYRYSDNDGKWWLRSTDSGGTSTETDSGVSASIDTNYELLVTINKAATEATFFINGTMVGRHNTNLPTGIAGGPSTQFEKTAGSSARSFKLFRFLGAAIGVQN